MERIVVLILLTAGLALAFDYNKLKNGNVDQQGIRDFGNQQKNTYLNDPSKFKSSIGNKLGYDESKVNGNISDIQSPDAKQKLIEIMSNMPSGSKRIYKCYEERIVKVQNLFKCSLNGEVFNDNTLCNNNCFKQHDCIQSSCIQTAQCERLTAGFVCPIQKTQCQTSISCPSGGTYNANTGKCEAQPL